MQESGELECLARLLQLSQQALVLIDSKEYYEEKLVRDGPYVALKRARMGMALRVQARVDVGWVGPASVGVALWGLG